jgi:hypothetical protein
MKMKSLQEKMIQPKLMYIYMVYGTKNPFFFLFSLLSRVFSGILAVKAASLYPIIRVRGGVRGDILGVSTEDGCYSGDGRHDGRRN